MANSISKKYEDNLQIKYQIQILGNLELSQQLTANIASRELSSAGVSNELSALKLR